MSGQRIRLYRQRLGMTQEVLAGLAGVSVSWLSQVERGERAPDSLRCLITVADVLGVDPMDLIEVPRRRERTESGAVNGVHEVVRVLRRDPWRLTGGEPDLGRMTTRLEDAESLRRQCRYAELGPLLATLIVDAETAARADENTEREVAAFTWLSHAYQTAAYTSSERVRAMPPPGSRPSAAQRRRGAPAIRWRRRSGRGAAHTSFPTRGGRQRPWTRSRQPSMDWLPQSMTSWSHRPGTHGGRRTPPPS
ncbi:MAG: helix-turn-helix domain protein, partial [Chloroflexi bacterium]|nr:helix-turn-helix domain protein [Chloroflexota bacterium]